MGRKSRSANLLSNLPQLQNLIKRDPQSYQEEFKQQLHHFEASLAIFELKPDEEAKDFGELIGFLSQVVKCYPKQGARFPKQLIELVQKHYPVLNSELRRSIVQALILLRSRGVVSNLRVMPLFFTLFRCHDKPLRKLLYAHIVNDVKNANKGKHRNHKLNKALQGFMYTMITAADAQDKYGEGAIAAKKSIDVCIDLYRKNIWTDAKAINVIAQACFSPITKVMMTAVQFFLHPQKPDGDDDSDSEAEKTPEKAATKSSANFRLIQHMTNVNKKTKARMRALERAARLQKRTQAKKDGQILDYDEEDDEAANKKKKKKAQMSANFDVLSLIHDPQGFAEKLFARVQSSAKATKRGGSTVDRFEVRLVLLKLISRLIGHHQLQLVAFYPFFQRYLQPHQAEVTQILAILATATNAFTPPDILQPLIRAIADNFVSDHCSPEVMCAGLNTIRAIAFRQPLSVEPDLLNDLVMYRKHKNKGVMMAARSLLSLYREINPEMLHRRDRGRDATMGLKNGTAVKKDILGYGETRAAEGVEGIELLEMYEEKKNGATGKGSEQWQVEDADSNGSGSESESGWVSADEDGVSGDEDADAADMSADSIDLASSSDERGGSDDVVDEEVDEEEEEEEEEADEEVDADEHARGDGGAVKAAASATMSTESDDKKQRIDMVRFLTNEDFDRIEKLKKRQRNGQLKPAHPSKKAKVAKEAKGAQSDGEDAASDEDDDAMAIDDDSTASASDSDDDGNGDEGYVEDWHIIGDYHTQRRRRKATYEERMETIQAGRQGRDKFSSKKAKRETEGRSLSNKEKRKTKDYAMVTHKRSIVSKGRRSLVHKRHDLRRHITKQRKNGF
ncbi:Severe Depolymerization of Actin [Coemansia sp. RSA 2599]|nr:Severe Depolymerization of Actin [Coemansia sp. RSA 2598]KAJ1828287.1 Severe Depolymerization of Actin [Coemansia sp. RSA 2599]